jgi:hypothetical protein
MPGMRGPDLQRELTLRRARDSVFITGYRIEIAMRSDSPDAYDVTGTVAEGDQWRFWPLKWLAVLVFQTGLAGEGH